MGSSQFMSVPYALYANAAASSATFEHPDGLNNITPVLLNDTIPFTVPAGKNLYLNYDNVQVDEIAFVNYIQTSAITTRPFIGASAGSQVKSCGTGFLVDAIVEWKNININCTTFTVPAGKIFIIIAQNQYEGHPILNGKTIHGNVCGQVLKAGDVIYTNLPCATGNDFFINGYLKAN